MPPVAVVTAALVRYLAAGGPEGRAPGGAGGLALNWIEVTLTRPLMCGASSQTCGLNLGRPARKR